MFGLFIPTGSCLSPVRHTRKGAVVVMTAVLLVVLLGCVAMAVDIGYLYVARSELQRAADAGALAGAASLGRTPQTATGEFLSSSQVYSQAKGLAEANTCAGSHVAVDPAEDVTIGYLDDPHARDESLQILPLDSCNAVRVIVRRDSGNSRGAIPLFFGPLLGFFSSSVSASAIATIDDRFYAYKPTRTLGSIVAIPFAVDEQTWNDEIVNGNGQDRFSYNPPPGNGVNLLPDNVREIKLYPEKLGPSGKSGSNAGAGNFGILHVGLQSIGTSTIQNQIINGISQQDFIDLTGEPMIKFYNEVSGDEVTYNAVSYDILGDPGLKAAVKDSMTTKIGKKVGFFLYSTVTKTGSNTIYRITGMRFGRVMKVDLTSGTKEIIIQPVPHYGPDIMTNPYVPPTDRMVGALELVR